MNQDSIEDLEQDLLSDSDEHQNISSGTPSISERYNKTYLVFLCLFSFIGYAYIFFSPIVSIYIFTTLPDKIIAVQNYIDVLVIALKLGAALFLGWISFFLFNATIPKPAGRPVSLEDTPDLVKLVDELQLEHKTKKIHAIKITNKFEMKLIRTPRNGFPLLFTNTLLIGLPLMQSLSTDQFKAALVNQLSHIRGGYKRPSYWIYFSRQTFSQYKKAYMSSWKLPNSLMRAFFIFYEPVYLYLSQSASRNEQLYADNFTLSTLGRKTLVDMIIVSGISQHYLESNFWPHLHSKAYKHKTPPYLPYASIEHNIQSRLDNELSQSWIDQSLAVKQQRTAEPSLRQRLANLHIRRITLPAPVMSSAAHILLGETLNTIYQQFDKVWLMTHQFDWSKKYQQGLNEQKELEALHQQVLDKSIADQNAWEYILLVKKYIDDQEHVKLFIELLSINTQDARIKFDIGRTLLTHLNPEGITALETAISQDPAYTVHAYQLITKYYVAIDDNKLAQQYRRKSLAYQVEDT